jgi:hypothetical protein
MADPAPGSATCTAVGVGAIGTGADERHAAETVAGAGVDWSGTGAAHERGRGRADAGADTPRHRTGMAGHTTMNAHARARVSASGAHGGEATSSMIDDARCDSLAQDAKIGH